MRQPLLGWWMPLLLLSFASAAAAFRSTRAGASSRLLLQRAQVRMYTHEITCPDQN